MALSIYCGLLFSLIRVVHFQRSRDLAFVSSSAPSSQPVRSLATSREGRRRSADKVGPRSRQAEEDEDEEVSKGRKQKRLDRSGHPARATSDLALSVIHRGSCLTALVWTQSYYSQSNAEAMNERGLTLEWSDSEESLELQVGPTRAKVHRSGSVDLQFLAPYTGSSSSVAASRASSKILQLEEVSPVSPRRSSAAAFSSASYGSPRAHLHSHARTSHSSEFASSASRFGDENPRSNGKFERADSSLVKAVQRRRDSRRTSVPIVVDNESLMMSSSTRNNNLEPPLSSFSQNNGSLHIQTSQRRARSPRSTRSEFSISSPGTNANVNPNDRLSQILELDRKLEASLVRSGERSTDPGLYEVSDNELDLEDEEAGVSLLNPVHSESSAFARLPRTDSNKSKSSKYMKWFRHTRTTTSLASQQDSERDLEDRMQDFTFQTQIPVKDRRNRQGLFDPSMRTPQREGKLSRKSHSKGSTLADLKDGYSQDENEESDEDDDEKGNDSDCDNDDVGALALLRAPFDFLHNHGMKKAQPKKEDYHPEEEKSRGSQEEPTPISEKSPLSSNSQLAAEVALEQSKVAQLARERDMRVAVKNEAQIWERKLARAEKKHHKRETYLAQTILDRERTIEARERHIAGLEAKLKQSSKLASENAASLVKQRESSEAKLQRKLRKVQEKMYRQRLTRGAIFLKHGRRGKPHLRLVYCDPALEHVYYAKLDSKRIDHTQLALSRIREIAHGHKTDIFKRTGNNESVGACFSLIWEDYSLNLEIPGFPKDMPAHYRDHVLGSQRQDWLSAFHWAAARAQGLVENEDDNGDDDTDEENDYDNTFTQNSDETDSVDNAGGQLRSNNQSTHASNSTNMLSFPMTAPT